jgi:capsular polysaccharide export protein
MWASDVRSAPRAGGGSAACASGLPALLPDTPAVVHAYGFPRWKWPIVRQCFPGRRVEFVQRGEPVPALTWLVLWGTEQVPPDVRSDVRILRVEDGFLRSAGLGADLVRPVSWVVDGQGIYYDATHPSDLEATLNGERFDAALLARATALRRRIVQARLSKYNVGFRSWTRPQGHSRVILVPGQVESDASIAFGVGSVRTNIGLLRAVRSANPDAYLVYKPHPDVLARLRVAGQGERAASQWCDEVVADVDIAELLEAVDEVHVLTSLAGFEALLRGKSVTCYGQPFYSGWGLTNDITPNLRRCRRLSIDELVAGALIRYPLYLSRDGKRLITPEEALDTLQSWRAQTRGREPWWRGIYRVFLRRIAGVR